MRDTLDSLLEHVEFNPESGDRLFSVGDLADRGPDSIGCLSMLKYSWFYSVIGNHDGYMLDVLQPLFDSGHLDRIEPHGDLLMNGGAWILDEIIDGVRISKGLQDAALGLLNSPNILVVGEGDMRFNIVHGDLYSSERSNGVLLDRDIDNNFMDIPEEQRQSILDNITSGRKVALAPFRNSLPKSDFGLSPTYCGHTPGKDVESVLGHINIDTGACYQEEGVDALTIVEHKSGNIWSLETGGVENFPQYLGKISHAS